jgi:hypothetical protein
LEGQGCARTGPIATSVSAERAAAANNLDKQDVFRVIWFPIASSGGIIMDSIAQAHNTKAC